jgi:hypothetical protein
MRKLFKELLVDFHLSLSVFANIYYKSASPLKDRKNEKLLQSYDFNSIQIFFVTQYAPIEDIICFFI